jgi:transposase InsO family protein
MFIVTMDDIDAHSTAAESHHVYSSTNNTPSFEPAPVFVTRKYKKAANKIKPVPTTLPQEYHIIRNRPGDPLETLVPLPTHPPDFQPGLRYTQDRRDALNLNPEGFLWPEEEKLAHQLILQQEDAFAWTESEKGRWREDYFPPIMIPTVAHVPWSLKNIPIPPGIRDRVIEIIKEKIDAGVYERSNSSYRSRWFCVLKKDGYALRIVHDLQPLNAVSIKDAAVPPATEEFAESFGGFGCYGSLDLFVAFDHRTLDPRYRDMTTFHTPIGAFRLTAIPMGYTNSVQIMQGDFEFILQPEIPTYTRPFLDDAPVKGPKTRYMNENGTYQVIAANPGVRRFVWEHLTNMNRIIQRVKHAGGTLSGKKVEVCVPEITVVGHRITQEGRIAEPSKVQKIKDWPPCTNLSEVRAFLGTCGTLRIFIKNYSQVSQPLNHLTRNGVPFEWGPKQQKAMDLLKSLVITSPALRPIDYTTEREVILAVDSSNIAVGFMLLQIGEDGKRYPSRFSSITWNEVEARYSQSKIELYGLFRALRASRQWLIGVKRLTVEVDAKYIKGMLNNPDIQPNATINRWIAGILLFDFKLVHVPGTQHTGADGLSRRPRAEEDPPELDDFETWIDKQYSFVSLLSASPPYSLPSLFPSFPTIPIISAADDDNTPIPYSDASKHRDQKLQKVESWLQSPHRPEGMSDAAFKRFVAYCNRFYLRDSKLWRRRPSGHHQLVIQPNSRYRLLREAHDETGHKGVFIMRTRLLQRFWWPSLDLDVRWYTKTCHQCQTRSTLRVHIPPAPISPSTLFRRVHIDTMKMNTASNGYKMIVQARCSLTGYPEWRMLRRETAKTLGDFIYEEILCRWGGLTEIVTDNGTAFIKAVDYLKTRYHIDHITISPYNSQANGIVERRHFDVREALIKVCGGIEAKWSQHAPAVFWAERISIQRSTGYSPYRMVHGIDPVLPFDITEATFLGSLPSDSLSRAELIAFRARQLEKRPEDLADIAGKVIAARLRSNKDFERRFSHRIIDYDFQPGTLVLARNTEVEKSLNRKGKPRYIGPYMVVRRQKAGTYILAELDGSLSSLRYATFRLVPYYPRRQPAQLPLHLCNLSPEELNRRTHDDPTETAESEETDDSGDEYED